MAENIFAAETGTVTRQEVKRYGYRLEFEISPDATECYCSYEPAATGGTPLTEQELKGFLAQFKIVEGIIPEAVGALLHAAATAAAISGLLLARGVSMVPGEDGKIVLAVSDSLETEHVEDDKSGKVDLRHVQSFLNVNDGDLIATIYPPGAGTAGRSVTGKPVPPQPGQALKLQLGQNVRLGEDGVSIYALESGRVYCRGDEISVEDIYVVSGDVDFKVGMINFKGFVEVKGDVLDGFNIKASKGIKIHGSAGVCAIESPGDISFCGVNGQGKASIKCGGTISASYIYDAIVECDGDINAEIEIRNCHISCLGAVRINKGGLSGGDCVALAGVETGNLGNVSSLRTRVVAGSNFRDLEELNRLFNELKQIIAEFTAAPKGSIDPAELARKRAEITEKIHAVRTREYPRANSKVNVRKMLYEGVNITLGLLTENVREERKGPLTVIENTIEGGFRFLGMTDLAFNAREIEKTFVQQKLLEQQKSAAA